MDVWNAGVEQFITLNAINLLGRLSLLPAHLAIVDVKVFAPGFCP